MMKPNWLTFRLVGKLAAVVAVGIGAGHFLSPDAYSSATTVVATFAGVVVAALVPTMILAATILRPVSKGKNEFRKVRSAVAKQISFFSGLFMLTIVLAVLMFIGSLLNWTDIQFPVNIPLGSRSFDFVIFPTRIVGGCVVALATLIAIQMNGFVSGIRNLFSLHADNAERELDRLIAEENRASSAAILPKDPRGKIGENIGELH